MSLRKMISLSLASASMEASRFKLRFRTLPEKRAASKAALMISETAALMISRFFVMTSISKLKGIMGVDSKKEL